MARASFLTRPAAPPRLEDDPTFIDTRDALVLANTELTELEAQWAACQRSKNGPDHIARLDAQAQEAELAVSVRRARVRAERARMQYDAARAAAQRPVTAWHLAAIKAEVPALLHGLDVFRDGPYDQVRRSVDAAIAAGVPAATLPLAELSLALAFGRTQGESYIENSTARLREWSK